MKKQAKSWLNAAKDDLPNPLYTEARYPTDLGLLPEGKPSLEKANEFYEYARNIYKKISESFE